jgi:hypothetical protein
MFTVIYFSYVIENLESERKFMVSLNLSICFESLVTGRWFSPGTPVSSTDKTDRHDITEILLKVALNIPPHRQ